MILRKTSLCLILWIGIFISLYASDPNRWQQRAEYTMEIDFDVVQNRFEGTQKLVYYNNSPDQLNKVFYHLYFNAFQPGSMMDIRSRSIPDPDRRIWDRISNLKPDEIGYMHVRKLKCNGKKLKFEEVGTILEVTLKEPIKPGEKVIFEMEFDAQVPIQIRRSGRDNAEGIRYSMAQWYPKLCEYDYQGWHSNPYIAREFYGVWGDFDVTIRIDHAYMVAATGYLQNPESIGFGYNEIKGPVNQNGKTSWRFVAENVHDFVWAADPYYTHLTHVRKDGTALHFFYLETPENRDNWQKLPVIIDAALDFINVNYGQYPYQKYSFIQGGDGGMEYPMATLLTGNRSFGSLVGTSIHELMHSWYQMILGTNESLYAWMDEGFANLATAETLNELRKNGVFAGKVSDFPQEGNYSGYYRLVESGQEEPLSTHADHFSLNELYSLASYSKGAVFLKQLEYVVGKVAWEQGMLDYFNTWKFKHPNVNDFIRVMESASGLELDWYKEYFVYTTKSIDYAIGEVKAQGQSTLVYLVRKGQMPMPLDVVVTDTKGKSTTYYIPMEIMRGEKERETTKKNQWKVMNDWPWTHPYYQLKIDLPIDGIQKIEIDPSKRMADIFQLDNTFPKERT